MSPPRSVKGEEEKKGVGSWALWGVCIYIYICYIYVLYIYIYIYMLCIYVVMISIVVSIIAITVITVIIIIIKFFHYYWQQAPRGPDGFGLPAGGPPLGGVVRPPLGGVVRPPMGPSPIREFRDVAFEDVGFEN